jgi:3-phenylpropionate/cinnamic acid dioxygenase small subunit
MKKVVLLIQIALFAFVLVSCNQNVKTKGNNNAETVKETKEKQVVETKKIEQWETPTDFQNRLIPKRLQMMQADNSGKPLTSWEAVADRQAIINQVTAYSFLIDEGRWDEWFALFSDDILFETTAPCFGTIRVKGKKAFKDFVNVRFRGPGSETNRVAHRHTMGNVHVAEQTDTTAEVRTYLLISNAFPNGKFQIFTSGTYNASLRKRNGAWIITRWYIETDAPVPPSKVDIPRVEFIPDTITDCSGIGGH